MWGAHRPGFIQDTIVFCSSRYTKTANVESGPQSIFLLSELNSISIFDNIPKDFTISTKKGQYHFNLEMLKETSPVITEFVRSNPAESQYFLNINDEVNVLYKFEQLFLGKIVIFTEDEIPYSQLITKELKIKNMPNCLKPDSLRTNDTNSNSSFVQGTVSVEINKSCLVNFLNRNQYQSFKITTKKNEYQCNIFGIYSSNVLRSIVQRNQAQNQFFYDFEDEYGEFQSICDFFNFKIIDINSNNMEFLKEIVDDLQIECIKGQINNFIENYKKNSQKIDENQTVIDSIDQLFELLLNIKTDGLNKVKNLIIQSKWSKETEKVQELAAFIIQIVKPTFSLQNEMADLLIALNNEADETDPLKTLLPFIVDNLMIYYMPQKCPPIEDRKKDEDSNPNQNQPFRFGQLSHMQNNQPETSYINEPVSLSSKCVYSFIRILYKKGIIPKERILETLKNYNLQNKSLNIFFLPEIIEVNPKSVSSLTKINTYQNDYKYGSYSQKVSQNFMSLDIVFFIKQYLPDKISIYEKMLDKMEPDDELTLSIRIDDVDTLQKIISRNEIDVKKAVVPYNIFDDFEENLNYLNYAAYCGSLKCFKYLLLNHDEVGEMTFYFAVYGGNVEIIKIVDQKIPDISIYDQSDGPNSSRVPNKGFRINQNNKINYGSVWFNNNNLNCYGFNNYNSNEFDPKKNTKCFDINLQFVTSFKGFNTTRLNYCNVNNIIASAIAFHRNDLFDWIFEKEFVSKRKIGNELINLAIFSAQNGNAHALIEIIDKGFDISSSSICGDVIYFSAKNGFGILTQLLMSIVKNNFLSNDSNLFIYKSSVLFGNLSIFKLFVEQINLSVHDLEQIILIAIEMNYESIVTYVFNHFEEFDFLLNKNFVVKSLENSIKTSKSSDLFIFLNDQFKKLRPELINTKLYVKLLDCACLYSNISATEIITNFILNESQNFNFSNAFIKASSSGAMEICHYFIDKKVYINYYEFSYKVEKLGSIDAELFEIIYNNVHSSIKYQLLKCINESIKKKNKKLIEFLLMQNAQIDTSLFEAVRTHDVAIVDLILKYNSEPSFVNKKSMYGTAIHIASSSKDLDIVKRLLSVPGINPGLFNKSHENALSAAITNYDIEIVDAILNFYGEGIVNNTSLVMNAFQTIQTNLKGTQVDKLMWNIVMRFLSIKSLDPNVILDSTLLFKACSQNEIEAVEFMLKLDKIDVNQYQPSTYYTPLIVAINESNTKIAELLIQQPQTDINLTSYNGESALLFAVKNKQQEIIELLVNDERFDQNESKLCLALLLAKDEIFDQLCSLSFLDVNHPISLLKKDESSMIQHSYISYKTTALVHLTRINDVDKIDMILKHPSFDKYKSDVYTAIFYSVAENNIVLFRKLIQLIDGDINIYDKKGRSLLVVAAIHSSGDIIDELLNDPQFDPQKGQICQAFIESFSNPSQYHQAPAIPNMAFGNVPLNFFQLTVLNQGQIPNIITVIATMNRIYNYDFNHSKSIDFNELNQIDEKSFFTSIRFHYDEVGDVSDFLLEHGVDPNKPDSNGVFPLEHAISIGSSDLVISLLNSERIDFSVFFGQSKMTYLHLAAMKGDGFILKLFLDKNVIDINSTDELGETPLMTACKARNIDIVDMLFQRDDLDFLHCNKEGKDAIDIIKQLSTKEAENARKSKDDYHNKIIELINEK